MIRSKTSVLAIGFSIAILGGILGKLALDRRLPWQTAGTDSNIAKVNDTGKTLEAVETQQRAKITFQAALRIAETAVNGKAYSVERETEDGKPVIEVGIGGKEVFVDAESGEIVKIENLYQKGDREDIKEIAEALKLQKLATIPIQEALQVAENFAGGQAHTVQIENEDGNLVYEVVIKLQEIYVDAGNGKLLYTETVGQVNKMDNSQPSSSIQAATEDSNEP